MYNIVEMEVSMKQQLKKGVLEIFVLAMLSKDDSYGYKLITDLTPYISITESTLYPILRRLEAQESLKTYNRLYNGRNRKYYKITLKGVEQIDSFMNEWKDIKKIYDILTKD
jgi:PadR family transcriptional regulator PadR